MSDSSDGGSNDEEPADDGWNMGATWDAEVGSHSATASSSTSKLAAAVIQEDCIQQEPEFELQQHEDNVYLEWIGQQCKVGHLSTLEKVDLPVGPSTWELEFHKGLGAVEAEDGQVLYLEYLSNIQLYNEINSGASYIKIAGQPAWNLTTQTRQCKPGTCGLVCSDLFNTTVAMPYFHVFWPRGWNSIDVMLCDVKCVGVEVEV